MAITKDDFGKVWASTSSLTPYAFSDAQYKEGWNFIGSTPPSRQMWDFLQKNNDEKLQYLLNNFDKYLPLSGGTLTGVVNGVTPKAGDNSKKLATTAFVNAKAGNYLPLSGGTVTGGLTVEGTITGNLDGNAGTATNATNDANGNPIAGTYLPLSGGTLTGFVNGVTPKAGDNSKKLATTAFVNAKAGLPVGFQYFQTNPNVPAGSLPLLGGEYSRTTYADLWAWVQTQQGYLIEESAWQAKAAANGGNVPFYSKGDGSTTFRVPALKCWVRGANSINEVGGYLAAGLPNITGYFGLRKFESGNAATFDYSGAFRKGSDVDDLALSLQRYSATTYNLDRVTFNASRSSAVYGNSTTVQPESIVGMWVVKAYGTVTNVGSTDVANISTGLTQAETRISALENHVQLSGVVQAFAGTTIPTGWLLCDGSAVSRTTYAKLFSVIGTTYGAGNGSTTFNLPNLIDKFVEGSATAGTEKSAGLPNITGSFGKNYIYKDQIIAGGAVTEEHYESSSHPYFDSQKEVAVTYNLNASRSSSVYGNSTTVQPPALTMRYIIKY